jgi:putative restriction endonuclease
LRTLLPPTTDRLFNHGCISFANTSELLISALAHEDSMNKMEVITDRVVNIGLFAKPQREFLEPHRINVSLAREVNV